MSKVMKESKKEVEVIEGMFEGDVSIDFAGISKDDLLIPFLRILQDISPQVKTGSTKVEGAEAGMLYNTATEQLWKGPVSFVPCGFKKTWVEWVPRAMGGGFVSAYETDEVFRTGEWTGKGWTLPNGHEIVPTMLHYGLIYKEGEIPSPVVAPFSGLQIKKSRQWISNLSIQSVTVNGVTRRPRIYSYVYKLSTVIESKDKYTWFGWNINKNPTLLGNALIFNMAKNFANTINLGKASVKFEDMVADALDIYADTDVV